MSKPRRIDILSLGANVDDSSIWSENSQDITRFVRYGMLSEMPDGVDLAIWIHGERAYDAEFFVNNEFWFRIPSANPELDAVFDKLG